jgi:probable F420-dependent oxidoreductase
VFLDPRAADVGRLRDYVQEAEAAGFDYVSIQDHPYVPDFLDTFTLIGTLIGQTSRLRFMTNVANLPLRPAQMLAKTSASLDLLSGGRFELGLGAGWMTPDYEQPGFPLDRPGLRIARLAEAIDIVRGLWLDVPFSYEGAHYEVNHLTGRPVPLTPGGPPIVVGGGGEKVLRLAARVADVVALNVNLAAGVIDERAFPDGVPEVTERKLGWIRESAGPRFGELELQVRVHLAMVTDDRAGVIEELAPGFGLTRPQAEQTPHALIGSVEQICDQLVERRERWGISYLGLSGDQLDAFAPVVANLVGT